MPCAKTLEELSAYVDGDLEQGEELSLRRHLDTCAVCRQHVHLLSALKETVACSAEVHPIPHTLREALSVHPRPSHWSLRSSWAMKAAFAWALILAVGLAGWWWQTEERKQEEIAQVLVADHIHYLQVPDALEISSADPARITAWFQDRVPYPVRVPRLNNARLLGGRLCSLLGQQVALVFYERGGRRLSLFTLAADVLPAEDKAKLQAANQHNPDCLKTFGKYTLCLMCLDDVVLAAVTEGPETEDLALSLFRPL